MKKKELKKLFFNQKKSHCEQKFECIPYFLVAGALTQRFKKNKNLNEFNTKYMHKTTYIMSF